MNKVVSNGKRLSGRLVILGVLAVLSLWMFSPLTAQAASTPAQKCDRDDVTCVINVGNQLITQRINALTTFKSKVVTDRQEDHFVNDREADALQQNVQENINDLSALKVKLDAETSAQAARQDVKAIFEQLRIFAVVLPRDYRRLHLDIEINLLDKLKDLQPHLEQNIDKAGADKQNQVKDAFNDFKTQLANAEGQLDAAQAILPLLTVPNFNADRAGYKANFMNLSGDEHNAHVDLEKAAKDLHQIASVLK